MSDEEISVELVLPRIRQGERTELPSPEESPFHYEAIIIETWKKQLELGMAPERFFFYKDELYYDYGSHCRKLLPTKKKKA